MKYKNKLSVIIPTKNRKSELIRLLQSIEKQDYYPEQLVIIDNNENPIKDFIKENFKNDFVYHHISFPSLTKSRNLGIKMLKNDISLVCFFDDDIVLEKGALVQMMIFWENAKDEVGGCSFNIIDIKKFSKLYIRLFKSIFNMQTFKKGKVLPSGFNNNYCPADKTYETQWLAGGSTVWRKKVLRDFSYDEWFDGYGYCEDLDFSYRVGKKYKLFVNAKACVKHLMDTSKKGNNISLGKTQVINRLYVVKKNNDLSIFCCLWANFGQCINNFCKGLLKFDYHFISRSFGNFIGILKYLLFGIKRLEG